MSVQQWIRTTMRRLAVVTAVLALFGGGAMAVNIVAAAPALASVGTNDYPAAWQSATDCSSQFGAYSWCIDADGNGSFSSTEQYSPLGFGYRNCTDYVAYELNEQMGGTLSNLKFSYSKFGFTNGNAAGWKATIVGDNYTANGTPAVGSVAWWGTEVAGGFGHVAIVTGITYNSDGSVHSITDADYNYAGTGVYATHTLTPTSGWPDSFLHVADDTGGSGGGSSGKAGIVAFEPSSDYMQGSSLGNGQFNWGYSNLTGMATPTEFHMGDVNGDGKADIVSFENGDYMEGISQGNGQFAWTYTNLTGMATPTHFAVGDINGDGKADIVAFEGHNYMEGTSQGTGQFSWGYTNLTNMATPTWFALGDVNGDGKADIVSFENGNYMEGISQGNGQFAWTYTNLKNMAAPTMFALGDFTGDHKADIVSFEPAGGGGNYMQGASQGAGTFSWGYTNLTNMATPTMFALGDFSGDGKADIVSFENGNYMEGASLGNGQFNWGYTNLTNMATPTWFDLGAFTG